MRQKSETLQTRVNADIYDRLIILCKIKNISLSEYGKLAITAAFNAEKDVYKALLEAALTNEKRDRSDNP